MSRTIKAIRYGSPKSGRPAPQIREREVIEDGIEEYMEASYGEKQEEARE